MADSPARMKREVGMIDHQARACCPIPANAAPATVTDADRAMLRAGIRPDYNH